MPSQSTNGDWDNEEPTTQPPAPNPMSFIENMCGEAKRADALSDSDLATALKLKVWAKMDMSSEESALVAAAIDRFEAKPPAQDVESRTVFVCSKCRNSNEVPECAHCAPPAQEANGFHPLVNRGSSSIAAGAAFELFMAWADRPTNAARVTEWMEPFFERAITTALAAQAGEVEAIRSAWLKEHARACIHHTDAEREPVGCNVCLAAERDSLEAERDSLSQQLAQVKDELDAAKKLTSEASIKHVIDKNLAR